MQQQSQQSEDLQQFQREERHAALRRLASALVAERKSIQHDLHVRKFCTISVGGLLFGWSIRHYRIALVEVFLCLLIGFVLGILLSRRNYPRVQKIRIALQSLVGKNYQQLCSYVEPLLKTEVHPADLAAVLELNRALLPNDWWMGEKEGHARFVALTTLLRLLGQAPESAFLTLEAKDRTYLLHLLRWILNTPTGWYLDTELPIRLFLALASAKEPGAIAFAEQVLTKKHEPRLVLAAQEYLQAVGFQE